MYNIMVLGGYGNFGKRISTALSTCSNIRVIVAGRNRAKADLMAAEINKNGSGNHIGLEIDIDRTDFSARLQDSSAHLIIHASGPFQNQPYTVAKACIEVGINYIDLADDRSFVVGIKSLADEALRSGVLVISGASSVPGLSSAVVNDLLPRFKELREISHGISPGNRSERGEATVGSILSYTGKAFSRWEAKSWKTVYGWQDNHSHRFPPPIGTRWVASCDVPDLALFPDYYPSVHRVTFYAGLELKTMHFGMWGMSWLTRMGIIKNWNRYTGFITKVSRWFESMGSDCGGMYVNLRGIGIDGSLLTLQWNLIAEDGHGPEIPTIASILLAKKISKGEVNVKGAIPCIGLFTLSEFMKEVDHLKIYSELTAITQ